MTSVLEPPSFVSDSKRFSEYKKDLLRWSRLTSVKEELQAEMVVYRLEGHPSNIKEKIVTQIGDKLVGNKDGIKELLELLEKIYGEHEGKTSKSGGTTSDARNELGLIMTTEVQHVVTETLLCMDSQWDGELCLLTATMEELALIMR